MQSPRRAALVPQEDGYDPYRLPYWIRASFIMEERWGELEAEFNAGKEAMHLAEDWGVVSNTSPPALHILIPAQASAGLRRRGLLHAAVQPIPPGAGWEDARMIVEAHMAEACCMLWPLTGFKDGH